MTLATKRLKKALFPYQTMSTINKHHVLGIPSPGCDSWRRELVVDLLLIITFLHQVIDPAELREGAN